MLKIRFSIQYMCRWVLSGLHNVKLPVFIYGNLLTELLKIIIINIKLSRTRRDSHAYIYAWRTMCELKTFFYTPNITSTELFSYIITAGNVLLLYYPIRALLLSSSSNAYTQPDIRLLYFIIIDIMSNNNVIISAARWWHNKRSKTACKACARRLDTISRTWYYNTCRCP